MDGKAQKIIEKINDNINGKPNSYCIEYLQEIQNEVDALLASFIALFAWQAALASRSEEAGKICDNCKAEIGALNHCKLFKDHCPLSFYGEEAARE